MLVEFRFFGVSFFLRIVGFCGAVGRGVAWVFVEFRDLLFRFLRCGVSWLRRLWFCRSGRIVGRCVCRFFGFLDGIFYF